MMKVTSYVLLFASICVLFVGWRGLQLLGEDGPYARRKLGSAEKDARRLGHGHKRHVVSPSNWENPPARIASTSNSALLNKVVEEVNSDEHSITESMNVILKAGLGANLEVLSADTPLEDYYHNPEHFPMDDLVDIIITIEKGDVLPAAGKGDERGEDKDIDKSEGKGTVPFLESWREVVQGLHCIIVLVSLEEL